MQLPPRRTWPRGFYIRIDTPIREPSNPHSLLEIFNQANTAFEFSIQREYRGPKGGVEMNVLWIALLLISSVYRPLDSQPQPQPQPNHCIQSTGPHFCGG